MKTDALPDTAPLGRLPATPHTPGPWRIRQPKGGGTAHIIWRNDEGPGFAGETNTNHRIIARDIHREADARLIAAAPDLLAALETLTREWDLGRSPLAAEWSKARAAIAKTEGRQ